MSTAVWCPSFLVKLYWTDRIYRFTKNPILIDKSLSGE